VQELVLEKATPTQTLLFLLSLKGRWLKHISAVIGEEAGYIHHHKKQTDEFIEKVT